MKIKIVVVTAFWMPVWCVGAETWPGVAWDHSTPEAQGMDSEVLAEALGRIEAEKLAVHSLTVSRHGVMVLDAVFAPTGRGDRHDIASCSKTVTALAIGRAIDEGLIEGPGVSYFELFPNRAIKNMTDRKRSIRLDDLLTMRSGLFCIQDGLSQMQMFQSPSWVQFCLDLPSFEPAGTKFQYFSLNSHLLSAAISERTGRSLADYARDQLFEPIGITDAEWPADPDGVTRGWGDLRLKPSDMARLGLLVLRHGRWQDRQVISSEWLDAMLTPRVTFDASAGPRSGYGYQIWIGRHGGVFRGRGGQRIMIVPEQDLVVTTTSGLSDEGEVVLDQILEQLIVSAVRSGSAIPDDAEKTQALAQRLDQARIPPPNPADVPVAKGVDGIDGATYRMNKNFYVDELTLTYRNPSEAVFRMVFPPIHKHPPIEYLVGLDGKPRRSPGRYGEPAVAMGTWDGATFRLDLDEIGNINHWTMELTFDEDRVSAVVREVTDLPTIRASGRRVEDASP